MAYIEVENLKYRYPNTKKLALDAVSGIQRTGTAIFQRRLRRESDDRKSGRSKDAGVRAMPDGRTGVPESL